ncbi:MAG: DMT family transporter [Desulfobacterales bacterium]|jgi:drug/metabolite transporter (DMT)-like permease
MAYARIVNWAHSEAAAPVLMILGASLISFSGVFVKLADVSPTISGFYRVLIGGLLLAAIAACRRERIWCGSAYFGLIVSCGLFFALDLFFWHRSIYFVGPGLATILANFQVFFLGAAGALFLGETLKPRLLAAAPLAVVGLFLIFGTEWSALSGAYKLGVAFGFCAAAFYSAFTLSLRSLQAKVEALSPMATLASVSLVTAGCLAATGAAEGQSFAVVNVKTLLSLIALGVVSQVIGWVVIATALPRLRASLAGLLLLLQPLLAFIWDVLFFHRPATGINWLGVGVALGAIYMGSTGRRADRAKSS